MIQKILIYQLHIPFQFKVTHNLAQRQTSESIIVILNDENGLNGYGEGAPRDYVTGETISDCTSKAALLASKLSELNFNSTSIFLDSLYKIGQSDIAISSPSAWCAVETACLDLFCKKKFIPIWKLFSNSNSQNKFIYSAVIPLLPQNMLGNIINLVAKNEIKHVKLKVESVETGVKLVKFVRGKLGEEVDIRVDANEAFSTSQTLEFLKKVKNFSISALEQPVGKNDLKALKKIKSNSDGVLIIADESVNSIENANALIKSDSCHGFNIRLSKCGGITNCLKLCQIAQENQLIYQIGCHVGESNILSALGRHLATLCTNYKYLEGSFSKYMLVDDITDEEISFGNKGTAPGLNEPGLGVSINLKKISKWAELKFTLTP